MRASRVIVILGLAAAAAAAIYGYKEYNRGVADTSAEDASAVVTAAAMCAEFAADENAANAKYVGKVLEVSGTVKGTEGNSLMLAGASEDDVVSCAFDTPPSAPVGTPLRIKGECSGSVTMLGTEVQLTRCTIVE